jgi:hypothetical protein
MSKIDLESKTKTELLKMAQRLGLRGISTLNKPELITRIRLGQERSARKEPLGVATMAKRLADAVKRRAIRKREAAAEAARAGAATARITPRAPFKVSKPAQPTVAEQVRHDIGREHSAHKFDVTPAAPPPPQVFRDEQLGELPEAYGTGRLFLAARDPHWLFAYWDLSWQQMADYRGQSSDGRLVLRAFEKNHPKPIQELTLGHDTRNWYIPVNKPATTYHTELGFWRHDGSFHVISRSREVATPPETLSADTTARFVTIPIDFTFRELLGIIRGHMRDGEKLADALHRLQAAGFKFPFQVGLELGPWSAEQAAALEQILGGDLLRRINMGSFEISEWLRRRLLEELSSGMFSAFSPGGASWPGAREKGFWFAVNAELIIYGATQPDAKVTIDGKPVKLRSDGTFSFNFAFPDGQYRLPVVAVSASADERREVDLTFERKSKTKGVVGKVKQPGHLKSPAAV